MFSTLSRMSLLLSITCSANHKDTNMIKSDETERNVAFPAKIKWQ